MQCPQTGLILRLVAGELSLHEEMNLRKHLKDCPNCESAWSQLHKTWDALGEWEVAAPSRDLGQAIVRATRESKPEKISGMPPAVWLRVLRIAASIALATGLGIATGTVVPIGDSQSDQAGGPAISDANVAESLGITELGARYSTGLGRGLGVSQTPEGKEVSS
jgi:hypothetical protein